MPFTSPVSGEQPKPRERRSWFIGASIGLALLLGLVTTILINLHMSASAMSFSSIPGSVPAVVAHSKNVSAVSGDQTLSLAIGLKLRNKEALQGLLQDAKNKKSINYGRHLTASQVQNSFSPTQQSYDAVVSYLQSQGFKIDHTYSHRLLISFSGTVSQVENAFHVQLNNYVDAKGRQYYANANDPMLPQELAGVVQSVVGLNNYAKLTYQSPVNNTAPTKNSSVTASAIGSNGCPLPYNPSVDPYPYLLPSQFATAYNYNGLYAKGYKGEGQSVALFEMSAYTASDLQTFINCFDQGTPTTIHTIQTSTDAPSYSGAGEVELDADIVLGMAPNLNQLRIYEAANDNNNSANYLGEWARIIADNVPVVSTGWRLCEANQGTSIMDTENNLFMTAAAQGQTIVAASGMFGSSDCFDRYNPGAPTAPAVDDPASQPYVTGVGATVLSINSDGSYASETTYNDFNGASGGGISSYWPHPSWQVTPGIDSSVNRQVPDVSLYGARYQGYLIYCSVMQANCYPGEWLTVGDPSAASAMWASFVALANEQSVKNGGYNLGFINPSLYQIASGSNYSSDFHDITTGTNDYYGHQSGKYPATTGYDMATGLGSLNAANLANDLVVLANAGKSARQAPTSKMWYFAEGSVGGGGAFQEFITLQNPDATTASQVSITYLFTNMPALTKSYTVNPSSRFTVNVNNELGLPQSTQYAISTIVQVTSGPGIVSERPMYFNYRGIISSGTDVLGASNPGTSYYFPLADTRQDSSALSWTYISILNPSATKAANVKLTYYDGTCGARGQAACKTQTISVGALMRGTGTPTALGLLKKVAVSVTSDQPIVVERPMYVKTNIATAGGVTTGAASQVGAVTPGTTWDFAQGNTGSKYQQYYVVANYGAITANVTVKLTYADATAPTSFSVPVAPYTQYTVDVNSKNANKPAIFGAEIISDQPVVVDREQFFHYGPANESGLTDVIGALQAQGVYSFAEGYVTSSFSEYISVQNPTDADETVVITYFGDNRVFQQQFVVKAHKVILVNVGDTILPFGSGVNSSTVEAMNGTVVAERVMYFGYHDKNGGTDIIGYTGN
ncbi:hypothetical protein KSD_28850 [Ktedonobacter sp. SOSP1-85]|uniref:S53 family peptidase n=1 Tax=Ktedonobacter sp. SOSP1-85 TaxID=2778367 RepID=UPI001915C99C|nr:S53 family peptidase [Ktedonobacter sp. SOSP1-85]GHO75114.1 hypothetical protein KSD_28850 [Ktedonobacter sp. SOSP1-85]